MVVFRPFLRWKGLALSDNRTRNLVEASMGPYSIVRVKRLPIICTAVFASHKFVSEVSLEPEEIDEALSKARRRKKGAPISNK